MNILDSFKLDGRTVVVTGAAGNLGMHFAESIASAGADLAVMDIAPTKDKLEEFAAKLAAEYGVKAVPYTIDISSEADVKDKCEQVMAEFGHIDGLMNVAGINHHGAVAEYTEEDLTRLMNINVNGTFACCKYFGGEMRKQGKGSIVNIASMSGTIVNYPPRTMSGYCISKAAVIHLTKAIAAEYGADNVRVNSISPGFLEKGMSNVRNFVQLDDPGIAEHNLNSTPMHRVARADELCGAAVYLLSDASSFTTGIDLVIDGGYLVW
jgi:gluconate 5-dehydrogenase